MNIKQGLVWGLVVCLALDVVPARVWAAEPHASADAAATAPLSPAPASIDFHTAVRDAVARLDLPSATATPAAITSTPRAAARATAVRRQGGGGKTGLIIGLVTTVVTVGVTLYLVKQMKKDENAATQQQ
jgi:hypothetical protein